MIVLNRIGVELAEIVRISEPIKSHWANEKGLDLSLLLSDNPYKEIYRREMIEWSDSVRARDPGYFCREAMNKGKHNATALLFERDLNIVLFFHHVSRKTSCHCKRHSTKDGHQVLPRGKLQYSHHSY